MKHWLFAAALVCFGSPALASVTTNPGRVSPSGGEQTFERINVGTGTTLGAVHISSRGITLTDGTTIFTAPVAAAPVTPVGNPGAVQLEGSGVFTGSDRLRFYSPGAAQRVLDIGDSTEVANTGVKIKPGVGGFAHVDFNVGGGGLLWAIRGGQNGTDLTFIDGSSRFVTIRGADGAGPVGSLGVGMVPTHALSVNGGLSTVSSVTASGGYYGSISSTTGKSVQAVKIVNESVTSSAYQDDDVLLLSLEASTTYLIEASIIANSTAAAPDFKFGFTQPAASTMTVTWLGSEHVGTFAAGIIESNDHGDFLNMNANVRSFVQIRGLVVTAGAGTLQFRWAQNNTSGAQTTVEKFSYLTARKLQ